MVTPSLPSPARSQSRAAAWASCLAGASLALGSGGHVLAANAGGVGTGAATEAADSAITSIAQALALTQQSVRVPAGARVKVIPGTLDPRLKLAPCARIEPQIPPGARAWGRTRVALRCVSGPVRWQVYLPLTVQVWARAAVLATAQPAGSTLTAADLQLAEVDLAAALAPAFTAPGDLVGRTLAVALPAGATVRTDLLRQRQWFQAGETVTVVAQGQGYAVSGEAQALGNGVEGQSVRLRTDSGRIITAMPVGTRRVELPL